MTRMLATILLAAATAAAGEALEKAVAAFREGRFEEAAEGAGAVRENDPDYPRARYLAGEIRLALGENAAAESAFRDALEKRPGSEPILTGLGRAQLAQGKDAEALETLEKAVKADAQSARAHAFLGAAQMRTSNGKKGDRALDTAIKLGGNDAEVVRAVVVERVRADDAAAAKRILKAFVAANKASAMGPFLAATIAEHEKAYDEAIAAYEKAIALDPKFLDAHKNLAILCIAQNPLYQNQERTKKALEHFEEYKKLGGRDGRVIEIYETLLQFVSPQGG